MKDYSDSELINVICDLSEIKSMKVAVSSSVKSGLLVGAAATVGGLLLGPRGIAIASLIAGLGTSYAMDGEFRSVPDILKNDLTREQQENLANAVRNLLSAKNVMSLAMLMTDKGLQDALVSLIHNFLKSLSYSAI
ncbi:protein C19orf12 homolog [Microplitis demolitor]|uniref:protein C19orf12 homolog n=1 Tax=Microplitis demolitor TaxID=69319 RepID=UPI0004CDA2F7|nr:protein C19orf12 homolog [Microplitis demolitor]